MPSTKDIDLWKSFKILLVGPNGFGKTVAAASFIEAGPVTIRDFDGRLQPIKKVYPDADIDYVSYGVDDFRNFLNWLEDIQRNPPKFKTIVIDSLTSLAMTCVMYSLQMKGSAVKTGAKTGLPSTSWDEVNTETVVLSKALEVMKVMNENHGINIIMTAHPITKTEITAKSEGNPEGSARKTEVLVAYGNKIGFVAPGYFNEIYRMGVRKVGMDGQVKRLIYTNSISIDDMVMAKTALPLPNEIDITDGLYKALMACKK